MALTWRELNRATLARQLLLARESIGVADAVRRVIAVQAQEPASPYVALWNRVDSFDPADLDTAFATGALVKGTVVRVTLHAVHAEDHRTFHQAVITTLRAARLNDRRFSSTGLTIEDADALVPHLLEFLSERRTGAEVESWLEHHLGFAPDRGVWWALRTFAPLVHAPTGGPWSFGRRPEYVAAPAVAKVPDHPQSVQHLLRRYLEAFGPASAQDFAQFALLRQPTVRPALEALSDDLVTLEGPTGAPLFDVPGAPTPPGDTHAPPRLMAMWDSILLAHADRGRITPPEYRQLVIRRNGDVLPTVLVDGYVCGVWRPADGGIQVTAFQPLPDDAWDGLAVEARELSSMLATREPAVYRRYWRWWESLPAAEVRVLPD